MHKSYAKVTAELFARRHPMGDDTDVKTRFTATQRAAYKPGNFRRWGKYRRRGARSNRFGILASGKQIRTSAKFHL